MPTNKELEQQLLELQDRVSALETSGTGSDAPPEEEFMAAVIRALVITRSQGAYFEAKRLAEKYFPGTTVEDFTSDKFTTTKSLHSSGGGN